MSDKDLEEFILDVDEIKANLPNKIRWTDFARFLEEKRTILRDPVKGKVLWGAKFPDDHFDQSFEQYFFKIKHMIKRSYCDIPLEKAEVEKLDKEDLKRKWSKIPEDQFKDPTFSIDPNKDIDKIVKITLKQVIYTMPLEELYSLFPEDFWIKVRNWITMFLEHIFLWKLHTHKTKFSPESLDKIIDGAAKRIVDAGEPPEVWSIEMLISYFTPIMSWTDKVRLHLLCLVFSKDLSFSPYSKHHHYQNLIYWLDPGIYIQIKKIDEDDLFLKIIPDILNNHPIPKGVFSKKLLSKIKKFLMGYSPLNPRFIRNRLRYKPTWGTTFYRLFLHFAYHGFVDGRVPGIKQGGYSTGLLEKELDELFDYNP